MLDLSINYLWTIFDFLERHNGAVTAVATVFIGVFTYVLALITRRQAQLTREIIDLALREFRATHRPKIIVLTARLSERGDRDTPARVDLQIINAGEAYATIVEITACAYIQTKDAAFVPFLRHANSEHPKDFFVAPGEFVDAMPKCKSVDWEYDEFRYNGAKLFVLGRIGYTGADNIRRNTGFCRQYSQETGMWHTVGIDEYEYVH
jgi:hypothetical protein